MRRCVMLCLTLIAVSACNGDKAVQPSDVPTTPSNAISDGNNCVIAGTVCTIGNPDFFFLPPMVQNPSSSPQWDAGAFNGDLEPVVKICASKALTVQEIASADCIAEADRIAVADPATEQYKLNWTVPSSSTIFYRVAVTVGTTTLGYADLETGANASQLKKVGTGEVIPLVDGRTLPIKFRVERFALCAVPGVGPCATKAIDVFGAGGKVSTALVTTKEEGIIFASNSAGTAAAFATSTTTSGKRTVTVERCTDFRDRGLTDLPTFGPCVRVRVEPALSSALTAPALVYSCDVTVASAAGTVSAAQAERIAMHRLVGTSLEALPHDHPDCTTSTSSTGSVRGMFADLRQGRLKSAARQVVAMLAPKPLYAARFIDLGGGGFTHLAEDVEGIGRSISVTNGARLSMTATSPTHHEFQFLLPAKFEFVETPVDRAAYPADQVSVSVKVTDLGDEPVMNARLRFSADQGGTVSDAIALTSSDPASRGVATVTWTVTPPSPNTLTVSGRGIGGENAHGPRTRTPTKIDPFQPCDSDWEIVGSALTCVETNTATGVGTGTMVLTATTVGDIAGRAINAQTGAPVVAAVSYSPTSPSVPTVASDGTFLIEDLTPGTRASRQSYSVTLAASNFESRTRAGVLVAPKEVTQLGDVCLTPLPGTITGTVVTTLDGSTITEPVVVTATETAPSIAPQCLAEGASPPAATVRSVTTSNGSFTLADLPPGNYSVVATSADYHDKSIAPVAVSSAATTTQSVQMVWRYGNIAGSVVDRQGDVALAGAVVNAALVGGPSGAGPLSVSTDAAGRFTLRRLTPGTYTLSVSATDYVGPVTGEVVVLESAVAPAGPFQLDYAFGSIGGLVRSSFDQAPLGGAKVTATGGSAEQVAFAGANGAFQFAKLPIGSQSLLFEASGYFPTTEVRELHSHEALDLSGISLTPFVTASTTVDRPTFTGTCPAVFTFTATIHSAVAGAVTYKWLRSDGANAPTETITFAAPGSQTVTTTWTLGAQGTKWQQLELLTPTAAKSNQSSFTLTCTTP